MNEYEIIRVDGREVLIPVERLPARRQPDELPSRYREDVPIRVPSRRQRRRREEKKSGHPIRNVCAMFAIGFMLMSSYTAIGVGLWAFAVVYLIGAYLRERGD